MLLAAWESALYYVSERTPFKEPFPLPLDPPASPHTHKGIYAYARTFGLGNTYTMHGKLCQIIGIPREFDSCIHNNS